MTLQVVFGGTFVWGERVKEKQNPPLFEVCIFLVFLWVKDLKLDIAAVHFGADLGAHLVGVSSSISKAVMFGVCVWGIVSIFRCVKSRGDGHRIVVSDWHWY